MIKAITFDLDMTLQDFMKFKVEGTKAAAKAMIKAGLNMSLTKLNKELFDFYLTDMEGDKVFENFLKKKGIKSEKILAVAINAYLKSKLLHLRPYPCVRKILSLLKKRGFLLGIITDAPKLKAYQRLDSIGICDYFDFVVGFEDTNTRKPSAPPFKKALSILNLKANEVMHVGDWPERDIKGAQAIGMKTCLANYGYQVHKLGKYYKPDYKIDSFRELIGVIDIVGAKNGKEI
ncbi:MAG: HAD-IA family hydrolase [Nanoarchaeota archaeon]|nr:HAD-IA family hydrolase [Nanoarchaeota archaeon]